MNKLLAANLKRLKKNKLFWIITFFFIVITFFGLIGTYESNLELAEYHANMAESAFTPMTATDLLFQMTPFTGLAAAFMLAIFIGTEYHDNTMRNKLICGQPRMKVYLANLLTCFLVTVVFWLIPIFIFITIGIPMLGTAPFTLTLLTNILSCAAVGFLTCAAFTAIFTLIAMLVHNRSYSLIVCIVLSLFFLLAGTFCESRLDEPETYADYDLVFSEDGTQQINILGDIPNPHYLTGNARRMVMFLYDFLPGGQTIQLTRQQFAHPYLCLLYSLGITGASTIAGIYFYRKKDLK